MLSLMSLQISMGSSLERKGIPAMKSQWLIGSQNFHGRHEVVKKTINEVARMEN